MSSDDESLFDLKPSSTSSPTTTTTTTAATTSRRKNNKSTIAKKRKRSPNTSGDNDANTTTTTTAAAAAIRPTKSNKTKKSKVVAAVVSTSPSTLQLSPPLPTLSRTFDSDPELDDIDLHDTISSQLAHDLVSQQSSTLDGKLLSTLMTLRDDERDSKKSNNTHRRDSDIGNSTSRIEEITSDLTKGQSYDEKIYHQTVKEYGAQYERERDEYKRKLEREYDKQRRQEKNHLKSTKNTSQEPPTAAAATTTDTMFEILDPSSSDSEEDAQNKKEHQKLAKLKSKEFRKQRRKVEHDVGDDDLLNRYPEIIRRIDYNEASFENNPSNNNDVQQKIIPVKPIKPNSIGSSDGGTSTTTTTTANTTTALPPVLSRTYELTAEEKERQKKLKTINPDELQTLESSLHNISFTASDMSWLINRLMHNKTIKSWIPRARIEYLNKALSQLSVVTREEEDRYLRCCIDSSERPCSFGDKCEGTKIPGAIPSILVEFLSMDERIEFERSKRETGIGKLPINARPCVMCRRKIVQYAFINFKAESRTSHTPAMISYCNLPDVAGEYSSAQMIKTSSDEFQTVIGFVVAHIRTNYRQKVAKRDDGTYFVFLQTGYYKPTTSVANNEFSVTPLNHIKTIALYNIDAPEKVIIDYFSGRNALALLPTFIVNLNSTSDTSHTFAPWLTLDDGGDVATSGNSRAFYRDAQRGHEFAWAPIQLEIDSTSQQNHYGIYIELVNRIDQLDRLCHLDNLPTHVLQALRHIQDRYQLLSLHVELKNEYRDSQLYQEYNLHCALRIFTPANDSLVFSMQCLPDLFVHIISCCQMWGDSIDPVFTNEEVGVLVGIMAKALPSPCKGRSLTSILADTMEEQRKKDTLLDQCFHRFIIASMLGIYPHSKVLADFPLRHIVYQYFSLQSGADGAWIRRWVSNNKYLSIYMMREFIFYSIAQMPGLQEYMSKNYFWYQIVQNTYYVMDHVRDRLNRSVRDFADFYPVLNESGQFIQKNFEQEAGYFQMVAGIGETIHWHPCESWWQSIEHTLDNYNKTNLSYCYRSLSKPFVDVVCHKIADLENKNFDEASYKVIKNVRWTNTDNISSEQVLPLVFEHWIEYIVTRCYNTDELPTYDALTMLFKVTLTTVLRLQNAQRLYEMETTRSKISSALKLIYQENIRDFRIIRIFFKALKKRLSIVAYILPSNIAAQQLDSELAYYGVSRPEQLPLGYGSHFLCTNCNEFKYLVSQAQVNELFIREDIDQFRLAQIPIELSHTNCTTNISLDLSTSKVYCSRFAIKADKQLIMNNDPVLDEIENDADVQRSRKKRAKDISKKDQRIKCPCAELSRVNMIGVMIRTDLNGCIMRCVSCPSIIKVSREWIRAGDHTGSIFACDRCQHQLTLEKKKASVEANAISTTTTTSDMIVDEPYTPQITSVPSTPLPNITATDGNTKTTTITTASIPQPNVNNNKKKKKNDPSIMVQTQQSGANVNTEETPEQAQRKRVDKFYSKFLPSTETCCLCRKKTRPKSSRKADIVDDVAQPAYLRFASFCKIHEHIGEWTLSQKSLCKLSDLQVIAKYELEAYLKLNPSGLTTGTVYIGGVKFYRNSRGALVGKGPDKVARQ